jgi:hypothetical protein
MYVLMTQVLLLLCFLTRAAASEDIRRGSQSMFRVSKGLRKLQVLGPAGSAGQVAAPASSGMAFDPTFTIPAQRPTQNPQVNWDSAARAHLCIVVDPAPITKLLWGASSSELWHSATVE